MKRIRLWQRNFNWHMLVVRILVNMLSLLLIVAVLPNVYFVDRRVVVWIFLSLMLGLLNAFVKPIIAFLTLRFIFATGGLVLAVINGLILMIFTWLFPQLISVDSILAAFLGGLLLGLAAAFLEALLGLNPPIVSEKYPEIRERVKDRQFYRTRMLPPRMEARARAAEGELAPVEEDHALAATSAATLDAAAGTDAVASANTAGAVTRAEPGAVDNQTPPSPTTTEPEA